MDLTEQKAKRASIVKEQRALLDAAKGKDLGGDDLIKYENLEKEFDSLTNSIRRAEKLAQSDAAVKADLDKRDSDYRAALSDRKDPDVRKKAYHNAFFGPGGFLRKQGNVSTIGSDVLNLLQTGVDVDGGFTVPEEYEAEIIRLLYNADPIRAAATVISLSNDRNIPVQTGGVSFSWLGENGAYGAVSPTMGRVVLGAHKLGGYIPVSIELLQDSGSNIEAFIRDVGVQAVANLENAAFAAGDGANKPQGLFSVSEVAGVSVGNTTGAVSATPAITGDELIDVFHSLGQQYRANAAWLTSDALVKIVRKLKVADSEYQYLWQPGLSADQPDRILNRPVFVSDYAPTPAASTKSIVFGDMRKYYIADRVGVSMQRLNELGSLNDQVYFKMSKRTDGRLTDANAVVTYTHGADS